MEVYKVFYPQGKADKFCSHVFKVFDTDRSGLIDFTEFLIAISVTAQGDARKKLILAFKMYDVDKNGTVDKKEMLKIIEAIYDLLGEELRRGENSPSERVKTIMNKLDKDNSGTLSENEFVEGMLIPCQFICYFVPSNLLIFFFRLPSRSSIKITISPKCIKNPN